MVTRFKSKQEAEQFIRDLETKCGVGVFHRIYKGHRDYCVQHNEFDLDAQATRDAGYKISEDRS